MQLQELRTQKENRINELCEEKNIEIIDDYSNDIFRDEKTGKEILSAKNWRSFAKHPELIDSTLDQIISKLESYNS